MLIGRASVRKSIRGWQLKVTVTEAESGVGIAGATCKILPENGTNTIALLTRKSAARGSFGVKTLPAGSYRITVSKAGYLTKSQIFSVTKSELERVRVALEKG